MKALSYLLGRRVEERTLLLITIKDAKTWKELYAEDGIQVQVSGRDHLYMAEMIVPDVPRIKKYWRANLEGRHSFITIEITGGNKYRDLKQQLNIDTRRRFTNILIVLEKR